LPRITRHLSSRIISQRTLWAFRLSALWFCKYIRLKLDTMTGTGKAITRTPLREHKLPTIFPGVVLGTISPYLKTENKGKIISIKFGAVLRRKSTFNLSMVHLQCIYTIWIIHNTSYLICIIVSLLFLQRKTPVLKYLLRFLSGYSKWDNTWCKLPAISILFLSWVLFATKLTNVQFCFTNLIMILSSWGNKWTSEKQIKVGHLLFSCLQQNHSWVLEMHHIAHMQKKVTN